MKVGDLVSFTWYLRGIGVKIRAPQRNGDGFVDYSMLPNTLFLILGELSHDSALNAAYTGQTQADVEHGSPYTPGERWLWCMAPNGVYAIRERSLELVFAYRSAA